MNTHFHLFVRRFLLLALCLFSIPLCVGIASTAEAAAAPIQKIAVVNLDQAFQEYEKTKTSDAKLEELTNSKQSEREKLVAEIKGMRDELVLLNQDSRAEKEKAIDEKLRGLASFDQAAKELLRKQREESVKGILQDIEATVTAYAKEHGYDLVLSARAILYQADAVDITKEIITLLNSRYGKKSH